LSNFLKEVKSKSNSTETKNVQLSVGISEHDIEINLENIEGHHCKSGIFNLSNEILD
jgi:translation initiation factor IF-3